ncbi:hypothetical protein ES703_28432 [subsurface metagenome]
MKTLIGDKEAAEIRKALDDDLCTGCGWDGEDVFLEDADTAIQNLLDTREAVKYKLKTDRRDWIKDAMTLRNRRDKETLCKCERERIQIRLGNCWLGLRMIRSFLKLLEEPDQFYQCFDYIRSTKVAADDKSK